MRTLVDIPAEDIELLKRLGNEGGCSRAELVRRAVAAYLEPIRAKETGDAFGLWANRKEDGLAYQQRIRDEWPD